MARAPQRFTNAIPERITSGPVIATFGTFIFQTWGLDFHEYDHIIGADFARKDVVQTIPQREWVGYGDEEINIRGRIFPEQFVSAWQQSEMLAGMQRAGEPQELARASGAIRVPLGWFVIERFARSHRMVNVNGVGRVVEFDASFVRVDAPSGDAFYPTIYRIMT